jgi:hypothetical protein
VIDKAASLKKLSVSLQHCYGIQRLDHVFEFGPLGACAVYAPNGSMKTSLARTFGDIAEGKDSGDLIFPDKVNKRVILDEASRPIAREEILVVGPPNSEMSPTEKTATLLVNAKLRKAFEALQRGIDESKGIVSKGLKERSGSKRDMAVEFAVAFTSDPKKFETAIGYISKEMTKEPAETHKLLSSVPYEVVFNERVLTVLATEDFKTAIKEYVERHSELLANSMYFKRNVFNYYNAETIAKNLAKNGFFDARHSVNLNAATPKLITTLAELEEIIRIERDQITKDPSLKKKFAALGKQLDANDALREFASYISDNPELLHRLENIESLRQDVLIAYMRCNVEAYNDLASKYEAASAEKADIAAAAEKEETLWERMILEFNARFIVPFKLQATNKPQVVSGSDRLLVLEFIFEGPGGDKAKVGETALMRALSTGEKKAWYVLNLLFEVEARRIAGQKTLLVVDDIADSFDYRNKYAIIQYLADIGEYPDFRQLILTHNFDFFRTVHARQLANYENCYMAFRTPGGIDLRQAEGFQNVFVRKWKANFFKEPMQRIACIPFMRNLVEFTRGDDNDEYVALTSLLHWRRDSGSISESDLDKVYDKVCGTSGTWPAADNSVVDSIFHQANDCLAAEQGINFENKIVLSIAIRLAAEMHMQRQINDQAFVDAIKDRQTSALLKKYETLFSDRIADLRVLRKVMLMTPENIHLNSFMYEPILDMSDEHLRELYRESRHLDGFARDFGSGTA